MTITGSVTPDGGEAAIQLRLQGSSNTREVRAIIDTGFEGTLWLPPELAADCILELLLRRSAEVELADGSTLEVEMYRVGLLWHDRPRVVRAYVAPGEVLIGMELLRGSRLVVDAVPEGEVRIEEL